MPEVNNGQDEAHNARQCRSEIKIMPVRQLALNTHTHTHTHTQIKRGVQVHVNQRYRGPCKNHPNQAHEEQNIQTTNYSI